MVGVKVLLNHYINLDSYMIWTRGLVEDLYRDAIPCKENIWSSILLSFRKAP
jgi:hypothetical protein